MVLLPLTFMTDSTINLMSGPHHECAPSSILRKYLRITHKPRHGPAHGLAIGCILLLGKSNLPLSPISSY